jgi:hypothetical protein
VIYLNNKLIKLLDDGFSISSIISPNEFVSSLHFYIPKKFSEKIKDKKLYILEKEGVTFLISGDE